MSIYLGNPSKDLLYYSKAIRVVSRHSKSYTPEVNLVNTVLHSALRLLGTATQNISVYKRYIHDPASFIRRGIFDSEISKETYEHYRNYIRNTS